MSEPCCPHCEEQYRELLERRETEIAELRDRAEAAEREVERSRAIVNTQCPSRIREVERERDDAIFAKEQEIERLRQTLNEARDDIYTTAYNELRERARCPHEKADARATAAVDYIDAALGKEVPGE